MSNKESSRSGPGFLSLLQLLFIGLKLTGYIDWSWWWVMSPLLAPVAVIVGVLVVWALCAFVLAFVEGLKR